MASVLFAVTVSMTAQGFLRDQMSRLADDGWQVHLACSPNDGTDSFAQLSRLENVCVHALPMARPPHPIKDLRSFWKWLRLLRAVRPDVVVASTPKAGLLATLAARWSRVPQRVYHVRGLRAEGLRGPLRQISLLSERVAVASANTVLVDSPSLLREMRSLGLLREDQGIVLGAGSCCGVDTEYFRPPDADQRGAARESLDVADKDFVVGFVGRLVADKGVRELVEAMTQVQEVHANVKLVLVGPLEESDALREALALVEDADWATATGPTSDTRSRYWAFDAFCLPSYREGFPIAPLEAQACGLPVVVTQATGCIDAVDPGVTGLTVPVADAAGLRDAILTLIGDRARRATMGSSARERAVRDFERRDVQQRFVEFIQNL